MKDKTETPRKGKRRYQALAAVLAVVIVVCGGVFYAAYHRHIQLPANMQAKIDLLPDTAAQSGTPRSEDLESVPEADSFRVVINQQPTVEAGTKRCNLNVENAEVNHYDLRVSLYLKETGELLGATHRIERGKRVDTLDLDTVPESGSHEAFALLELFDGTLAPAGELRVDVTLVVQE